MWQEKLLFCILAVGIFRPSSAQRCETIGGNDPFCPCVFPFTYDGETYQSCTKDGDGQHPWCSTQVDGNGNHVTGKWGYCGQNCPLDTGANLCNCKLTPADQSGPFYVKQKYTLETKCIAFSQKNPHPEKCDDDEYTREPIIIQGKILDSKCNPVDGAIIEYWQAAPHWSESHPSVYTMVDSSCTGLHGNSSGCINTMSQSDVKLCESVGHVPDCITDMEYKAYRGWQQVPSNGDYQLKTVRPGIYDIRPIRHIHIKITVPGQKISGQDSLITQLYLPQDEPTEDTRSLYENYIWSCEQYRINPEQWAKKQPLDMCPVRKDPQDANDVRGLTTYNWDVVLDI